MIVLLKFKNLYAPDCFSPTKHIGEAEKLEIATAMSARIKEFLKPNYPEAEIEVVSVAGEVERNSN